jgi:hypothetical protein
MTVAACQGMFSYHCHWRGHAYYGKCTERDSRLALTAPGLAESRDKRVWTWNVCHARIVPILDRLHGNRVSKEIDVAQT